MSERGPSRPVLRYHGGKWRLAPWIISHFPPHRIYVEPYGGAASVLLRKPRAYCEIYNDLDDEIVSLFRLLRDPAKAERLRDLVAMTPYARAEFEEAYGETADEFERSRRTLVRSWMGHGSSGLRGHKTGFRLGSKREHTTSSIDWANWPKALPAIVDRLQGVMIEKRPALSLLERHDEPDTLFYVDPPYVFSTRSQKRLGGDLYHGYRHEMSDDDHGQLLDCLSSRVGMVVLSGYRSKIYDDALGRWHRIDLQARADRGEKRTESLWMNEAAVERGAVRQPSMVAMMQAEVGA
ncbi:D12 class N6 adenine-specific DNA methyltransferase [Hyphomicrobium denitrificans ATCC 51888]|uniref:D12 class N6 adenine-specific DNA methyltransferase n=1 Tax=Hyphomicrobium denitrificans (strain ATCC 51888 / DSM 1869 / NCIMB 11706 / TK 0415) TaxID=582899 RepID=D8JVW3_HYPDA|nr:DNA adenine methylase [Hyphomicrobium denitrificans]ADJ23002.1 D12 class N6 adenine-specific DNA methyltransferase [Hyphomicrobium denitrificans ATCC 51888]